MSEKGEKKIYEKPMILPQKIGMVNKYQTEMGRSTTEIDGVAVTTLLAEYGSPLFVFSERAIRSQVSRFKKIFRAFYPNTQFAWSYKTNYLDAICALMHHEGSIAEVVSYFEYEKARRLGVPGSKIIFNGPHKPPEALERAVREEALINVDNFDEIFALEELAAKYNRPVRIGMRLNLDAGIYPQWSRFGFNLESGQALSAARRIHQGGKLELVGLHCHIGTFILDPNAYARQLNKMVDFGDALEDDYGRPMEYYNIGGGLPSRSQLKGIYLAPDHAIPPIDDYARAIGEAMLARCKPDHSPKLYLESGRALIDEAGYLLTSVVGSKRLQDGKKTYIIDAGVNLLYTSHWYNIGVKPGSAIDGPAEDSILYGPLCMNIDVVRDSIHLPPLPVGSPLVLHPVGAYNVTQWMQFIEYRPAIVLVSEDGTVELIRRREALEDVTSCESLPERLRVSADLFANL
ncbi:MAG: diaminopimelate decarboxylase [Candidatus Hydrogenedentota bacterium]|nr:MAG: diaminopimelate decarboxylase [Candidatus Hydrogenedentota bacterium]